MDEKEYQALIEKRGLHGLVSRFPPNLENASSRDLVASFNHPRFGNCSRHRLRPRLEQFR